MHFLLTDYCNREAAKRFLRKPIHSHGMAEKITLDKSGANTPAIESYNAEQATDIERRQAPSLNHSWSKTLKW